MDTNPLTADMVRAIRFLTMDAIEHQKSGHPGTAMGAADLATVLFSQFMKFDPANPLWPDRDRFILSAGHASMLLYSVLYLSGYKKMNIEQLKRFRCLGSRTAGHPEYNPEAGIDMTTGPLGQGFASGVGMALAERMLNSRYGDDIVDHWTYVLAGDGCMMDGVTHEAAAIAGHYGLGRLVVFWDDNKTINDGPAEMAATENYTATFAAKDWHVQHIDGHNHTAIAAAIRASKAITNKPSLIRCTTIIGQGSPSKAGKHSTHATPLGSEDIAAARKMYNWPYKPFQVPDRILSAWHEPGQRGAEAYKEWQNRVNAMPTKRKSEFKRVMKGNLPEGWENALHESKKHMAEDQPNAANIANSGNVITVLAEVIPELVGAAADLEKLVACRPDNMSYVSKGNFSGRYIQYGIRENAMGSGANGVVLHRGLRFYAGTYLVFSSYLWPAIRQSALMRIPVIYVFGDDSIGIGTNGPTHQPVEFLAGLRAIPYLNVFRPADAIETAECWELALKATHRPTALCFARQPVPTVRTTHTDENLSARGAYVLAKADGTRRVSLLATGSEVSIALKAREILQAECIPTAVVSMPCWEIFEEQSTKYKAEVLGSENGLRVGIEAAVRLGWDRYIGSDSPFIGMNGFGASAPAPVLYEHFGITAETIVEKVRQSLSDPSSQGSGNLML